MGVWERSPAGIAIALENEGLVESFRALCPTSSPRMSSGRPTASATTGWTPTSAGRLGSRPRARRSRERGLGLMLDFVPNHVAPDHPWTHAHPEYFVRGNDEDLERDPASFVRVGGGVLANGRDPYFPAWPDVVQLNAFSPDLRAAVDGHARRDRRRSATACAATWRC